MTVGAIESDITSNLAALKITRPQLSREDVTMRAYLLAHSEAFWAVDDLRERVSLSPPNAFIFPLFQIRNISN